MSKTMMEDIRKLSVPERILLVEDIWDSIAEESEDFPLTQAQREELDRRIEAFDRNPGTGSPWEDIRRRVRSLRPAG